MRVHLPVITKRNVDGRPHNWNKRKQKKKIFCYCRVYATTKDGENENNEFWKKKKKNNNLGTALHLPRAPQTVWLVSSS